MAYLPSTAITITFYHSTASLLDSDFTKNFFCDGVEKSNSVTITEVKANFYSATFTPSGVGLWDLHISESGELHHFTFKVEKEETLQLIRSRLAGIEQRLRSLR